MRRIRCNSEKGILITQNSTKFLIVTTAVILCRQFVNKLQSMSCFELIWQIDLQRNAAGNPNMSSFGKTW